MITEAGATLILFIYLCWNVLKKSLQKFYFKDQQIGGPLFCNY